MSPLTRERIAENVATSAMKQLDARAHRELAQAAFYWSAGAALLALGVGGACAALQWARQQHSLPSVAVSERVVFVPQEAPPPPAPVCPVSPRPVVAAAPKPAAVPRSALADHVTIEESFTRFQLVSFAGGDVVTGTRFSDPASASRIKSEWCYYTRGPNSFGDFMVSVVFAEPTVSTGYILGGRSLTANPKAPQPILANPAYPDVDMNEAARHCRWSKGVRH